MRELDADGGVVDGADVGDEGAVEEAPPPVPAGADVVPVLEPAWQIDFFYRVELLRDLYLREALQAAVRTLDIPTIDRELAQYAGREELARVAAGGLRGERIFAVPSVLEASPYLLGYYRLLYGFSQKACYGTRGPYKRFKPMEERGVITARFGAAIPALCRSLAQTANILVRGVNALSVDHVHELQCLTLGATFDGSRRNTIGQEAGTEIRDLVRGLIAPHLESETPRTFEITNAAGRLVRIVFADDPDVRITELLPTGEQALLSIEIKGGSDGSNVHNRLGEAEKSHLKARRLGYHHFWTIIRARFTAELGATQSPTTTAFFVMDAILDPTTQGHREFRDRLCATIGIPVVEE